MNVKELREILADLPDEALVVVSNPKWKTTNIVGYQFVDKDRSWRDENGTLYLDLKNFK